MSGNKTKCETLKPWIEGSRAGHWGEEFFSYYRYTDKMAALTEVPQAVRLYRSFRSCKRWVNWIQTNVRQYAQVPVCISDFRINMTGIF